MGRGKGFFAVGDKLDLCSKARALWLRLLKEQFFLRILLEPLLIFLVYTTMLANNLCNKDFLIRDDLIIR